MSTDVCPFECQDYIYEWLPVQEPIHSIQKQFHEGFIHTTHTSLRVCDNGQESPQPVNINVNVVDPSKNSNIPFTLRSTDTAATLIKKYLEMRPELVGRLRLAYNGKRVSLQKSMKELGVKPGAVFITFQRCTGG